MTVADVAQAADPLPRISSRAQAALEDVLQQTLLAPLAGEFHDKFLAMFHAPGDRGAAKALRACVRRICENAAQQVLVSFSQQVSAIANAAKNLGRFPLPSGTNNSPFVTEVEEKIQTIEEKLKELEQDLGV